MTQRGKPNLTGLFFVLALAISASAFGPLSAQTHKVAKPETVVRAVGVYEWTGDLAKPTASRLIPVSLFIDSKLEDAAVYLARPVPLAILVGNLYELDQAGVPKGNLEIWYARHLVATDEVATAYDDGWFGYGEFVPPVVPKKSTLKPSKTLAVINGIDDDPSKPHFSSKSATPGTGEAATSIPGLTPSTDTPPDDPDRPTMKRHPDTSDQTASTAPSGTTPGGTTPTTTTPTATPPSSSGSDSTKDTPSDDADRPTLRRRAQADPKTGKVPQASVSNVGSLNDDPNRPMLHRGKPAGVPLEIDLPKLSGLPGDDDLHQIVAVSDAANRSPHDFARAWADEAEHQAILAKMQAAAHAQLALYDAANGAAAGKPAKLATAPPDTRHPNSKLHHGVTPDSALTPPEPLLNEQLKGYTLSYGGAPTYVYSAHTGGLGSALRFVTLVAQIDMQGEPQIALKSVTDAAHLDRNPRYRLVDVVDAEASNRASLLFELRGQDSRQFALYRVIGARADQTFLTGTTQ
jgi:hypothetical protein